MARSAYSHIAKLWNKPRQGELRELHQQRLIQWRREPVVTRAERPTRPDRARALGYKAKQGIVVARTRVRRGGLRKKRHDAGRAPSKEGVRKITMAKSTKRIAEERANKKFPNLEVLNSYYVADDGRHLFYEVILVDPHHPSIKADKKLNWIGRGANTHRAERGLTSAGKKGRGLRRKGKGAEKVRPGVNASGRTSK